MSFTISFAINAVMTDGQRTRAWSLPLVRKTVTLARRAQRQAPGRFAVACTVAGIVAGALVWGVLR